MFRNMVLIAALLSIFMVVPAIAGNEGCRNGKFVGSYTRPTTYILGPETHTAIFQLTLNGDGTANQYWTGLNDLLINEGTGSPQIGTWKCRSDGKLIVTLLSATYSPIGFPDVPNPDVILSSSSRTTYLFTVDNDSTLTSLAARIRTYAPNADPSDPAGGTLSTLITTPRTYTRVVASDADLLAP